MSPVKVQAPRRRGQGGSRKVKDTTDASAVQSVLNPASTHLPRDESYLATLYRLVTTKRGRKPSKQNLLPDYTFAHFEGHWCVPIKGFRFTPLPEIGRKHTTNVSRTAQARRRRSGHPHILLYLDLERRNGARLMVRASVVSICDTLLLSRKCASGLRGPQTLIGTRHGKDTYRDDRMYSSFRRPVCTRTSEPRGHEHGQRI